MYCEFCNKECLSSKSLNAHRVFCRSNPDRKNPSDWSIGNRKGKPSWNSGLVNDSRCRTATNESRQKMSSATTLRNKNETKETRQKRKNTIVEKVASGKWHTSLAKHMHIEYNGIDLHGSWEVAYAKYLDFNCIRWKRNTDSFEYVFEGRLRRYTPDFYLIDTEEYIEIKAYKTEKDDAKWRQFPEDKKLTVLMYSHLKDLQIIS